MTLVADILKTKAEASVPKAIKRRIKVDEVQPLGAGVLPAQRGLDRLAEALLGPIDALDQLDGLATQDVDGGQ